MFGAGALSSFGSSNISSDPLTNDAAANEFALKAGLTLEVEQQLRALEMPMRLRVLTVLNAKMQQQPVQNPSMYLAGIIRNENRVTPYKSSWGNAAAVGPDSFQNATNLQQLRTVASPQSSPRMQTKPPPWVAEVFPLATRPSLFLRKMHEVLGAENMQLISMHPALVQVSFLMTLLLTPAAWGDAAGSFKGLLHVVKEMPPMASAGPTRPLQRSGRPLVILQFGISIGAEWVCLKNALENLKGDFPDIRVEARHAFRGEASASGFYEAITSAVVMEGSVVAHKDAPAMAAMVSQQLAGWKNADATVLVLMTLPPPDRKSGGPVAGPQWHVKPANAIWEVFDVLRLLANLPDNRYACLTIEPVPDHNAPSIMLDQIFGDSWTINKAKTRVPTATQWRVRSWPALSDADLAERKIDRSASDVERFHSSLLERHTDGTDVSLPTPEDIEQYYDGLLTDMSSQRDLSNLEAFKLLHSTSSSGSGGSGPAKLLERSDLARLWGVDGWNIDSAFSRLLPCTGVCFMSTGFKAPPQRDEGATNCGTGRWCFTCDQWYAMLNNCPPPHAWTLLEVALRRVLAAQTSQGSTHFSRLPSHSCDGSGCNCY